MDAYVDALKKTIDAGKRRVARRENELRWEARKAEKAALEKAEAKRKRAESKNKLYSGSANRGATNPFLSGGILKSRADGVSQGPSVMEAAADQELLGSIEDEDEMNPGLEGPHFGSGSDQLTGDLRRRRSLRQHQQVSQRPKMVVRRQHSLSSSTSTVEQEPPHHASVTDVRVVDPA